MKWIKQLGTSSRIDSSYGVATDSEGNVFITGSSERVDSPIDIWVAKYGSNGTLKWKKQLGTFLRSFPSGVATDSSGNVLSTGITDDSLGGPNKGLADAWVAKYGPNSTIKWKKQLGTARTDTSYGVATDSRGNVFITGFTEGDLGGS